MSNKIQTIASSKLLENKAKILFRGLSQDFSDLQLQEKEEILMKYNDTLKKLYATLATPLLQYSKFREGKPVEVQDINNILRLVDQDLQIVYEEFANLRSSMANNFNSLSIQSERVRTNIATIVSDLADYRVQNQNSGFFTFSDSFKTMKKIEGDDSKYKEKKLFIDNEWEKAALPLTESDPKSLEIKALTINQTSNGLPGNNQELGALKRDAPSFMNDKNLDTWYEYERVSRNKFEEPLILEFEIELKEEKIINLLELNLVEYPNGSAPAVTEIETSNDGVLYLDYFKNYIGQTHIDSRGDEVIQLGSPEGNPVEKNRLLFFPKKAKYIRVRMIQDSEFIIKTPSGLKNRLAMGIKEVAIKGLKFKNKGQLLTNNYSSTKEIGKVFLKTDEYIPEGFPVTIDYSISSDNGQKWHKITPTQKTNLEVPEVLNFNLDFIDASIKTEAPVTTLKLKSDIEIKEPKGDSITNAIKREVPITQFVSIGKGTKKITLEQIPLGAVDIYNVGFGSVGRGAFYKIQDSFVRDREDEYSVNLPLEAYPSNTISVDSEIIYCEDTVWERVEDLALYGADDRVYEFDYINNRIRFAYNDGVDQFGKKPSESIFFKLKRESAIFEDAGKIRVITKFLNDGVKDSISLYQIKEELQTEIKRLKPRNQVHSLGLTELDSVTILQDEGSALLVERDYLNGYSELKDLGEYSIDYERGVVYTFSELGDTDITEVEVSYREKEQKKFTVEDGEIYIDKDDYSVDKKEKVITPAAPTFVIDLGEKNIEKGSLVYNVVRNDLLTELAFTGNGREFDEIDDVEGPYSVDYRNGLLYVPEKISGEISVRFNTTNFFVEYNVSSKIPKTDITIKEEEKYVELSDSYVIKFFADSNISSTDGLFKLEYKYAEEVKEPPKDLLEYVSPLINGYEILTVYKEDL